MVGLLFCNLALAQSVSVGPMAAVVGHDFRPGVRVSASPSPSLAIESQFDMGTLNGAWDAGIGIVGRAWLVDGHDGGLYLLGRGIVGARSNEAHDLRPWMLTVGGVGGQLGMFYTEADVGLDWGMPSFRTEISVGVVFEGGGGSRWQRHRPTRSLE